LDPTGPVPPHAVFPPPSGGEITPWMMRALQEAGPWTRFLAIIWFFVAGMNGLSAVFLLVAGRDLGGAALILAAVYAAVGGMYLLWGLSLFGFAGAVNRISTGGREAAIERALGHARDFWKRVGISTIAGFVVILFAVLLGLGLAGLAGKGGKPDRRLRAMERAAPSWWRPSALPAFEELTEACAAEDASFLCVHEGVVDDDGELVSGRGRTMLRETVSHFVPRREGWDGTRVEVTDGQATWILSFIPPEGRALLPGSYGAAPGGRPMEGLTMRLENSAGRACRNAEGRFRVDEIDWDADGGVRRLALDFEASCPQGKEAWRAVGRLRFVLEDGAP